MDAIEKRVSEKRGELHGKPEFWPVFIAGTNAAESIIRKIGDAACELIIVRNDLLPEGGSGEELDMDAIKEDLFNVLMGHDSGCLDPEDLDETNNEYLWVEQHINTLQEDALLASERSRECKWTKDVPTEQGEYWHWNGNPDAAPFPLTVMYSATRDKCFVCVSDMVGAPWCDEVGGWWMRMTVPALPSEGV